jgi:hypothetical protein
MRKLGLKIKLLLNFSTGFVPIILSYLAASSCRESSGLGAATGKNSGHIGLCAANRDAIRGASERCGARVTDLPIPVLSANGIPQWKILPGEEKYVDFIDFSKNLAHIADTDKYIDRKSVV